MATGYPSPPPGAVVRRKRNRFMHVPSTIQCAIVWLLIHIIGLRPFRVSFLCWRPSFRNIEVPPTLLLHLLMLKIHSGAQEDRKARQRVCARVLPLRGTCRKRALLPRPYVRSAPPVKHEHDAARELLPTRCSPPNRCQSSRSPTPHRCCSRAWHARASAGRRPRAPGRARGGCGPGRRGGSSAAQKRRSPG